MRYSGEAMTRHFKIDGWTWHEADRRLVEPWFARREELRRECSIKGSDLRDVFRVAAAGNGYYVKYHHPDSLFQQVRSGLIPKARREFEAARRLAALDLPVVAPVGWGYRGSRSMLLTRECPDAIPAREFWFGPQGARPGWRKRFLAELGGLLRRLFDAQVAHPDLHLGNLLVTADRKGCRLTLVDVYGVIIGEPLDQDQRLAMLSIVAALRGELSRPAAIEFFRLHGLAPSFRAANDLWQRLLTVEARRMEHLWPKRRRKLLACHPRYARLTEILGREWRIAMGLDGQPLLSLEQAENLDWRRPPCEIRKLSAPEAERLWLASFRLTCHRIHHPRVLAWLSADEGEEILLVERLEDPVVAEGARRQELLDYLALAGIQIPDSLGSVVISRDRVCLRDAASAEFAD